MDAAPVAVGSTRCGGRTYDGSRRVDSGLFLGNGTPPPFKVTFTKPGVYKFFCDIHRGMVGEIVVKPKGVPLPSPAQVQAALKRQEVVAVKGIVHASEVNPGANTISVGRAGAGGAELLSMFPATLRVKAGTVVKFTMSTDSLETHTATFGPTAFLNKLANGFLGDPTITQEGIYPTDNPALGPIQVSPSSHGNGFAGAGGLDRDPTTPLPVSQRIQFRTPGTYHYICLIHSFMKGTIIVH